MSDFINTIDALGDDAVFDSIIQKTVTEFKDDTITKVGKYAFYKCTALQEVAFPETTIINDYAFDGCSSLQSVNVPLLATVGRNGFSTTDIKDASFPLLTNVNVYAFANCASLEKAVLPKATSLQSQMFYGCPKLESVDVSSASWTGSEVFKGCTSLTALIVRKTDAICNMANGDILTGTPIASGAGYIYVPAALYDSYKAATGWSTYTNRFRKLEEWTVDNTMTGELIDDAANKHVVHFYNSDGTPLGYTIVTDGGNAVYSGADPVDPAGANPFAGFNPNPVNVTEDMDCYAKFADAWDAVLASIDAGTYATDYAIGDTVPLDLGSEGLINMQIAAFDTDDLADGSGKAPITWIANELLKTKNSMNPNFVKNDDGTYQVGTGVFGGWEKTDLRAYLKDTIKPMIPETVRNSIKEVTKSQMSYSADGKTYTQTTTEDVWIPSEDELCGNNSLYYGLYENKKESRIKKIDNSTCSWWLRSVHGITSYDNITSTGGSDYNNPTTQLGVCLCFCT